MFTAITQSQEQFPNGAEFALAPDVILVLVQDGTARLLDMQGDFYAVSNVGAAMLRAVCRQTVEAAAAQVAAAFGADPRQVRADLDVFVQGLKQQGLLIDRRDRPRQRRSRAGLAAGCLAAALRLLPRLTSAGETRTSMLLTLAHLSFRFLGWTRTVALWGQHFRPAVGPVEPAQVEQTIQAVDEAVRRAAAQHPLHVACKERALCCWALARAAGIPAALVLGLTLFPLGGHCWCAAGPWTCSDDRSRIDQYLPVIHYQ